jgi:peptidyl-prolyl cis-trans isomerase B (cyclophilin B)
MEGTLLRLSAFLTLTAGLALGLTLTAGGEAQAAQKPVQVKLSTSMGDITLELYPDKAPATVANFLKYVNEGFYDGTIFHRVIDGFMIQGGGMDAQMKEKATGAPIQNEADNGLKNDAYTIAMARTQNPHSASAQFFINVKDNDFLNHSAKTVQGWGYAVFGKVVAGKEVVDKIKVVATGNKGFHQNVPLEPVILKKATVVSQ